MFFLNARACLDGKHHSSPLFRTSAHNQQGSPVLCKYSNYSVQHPEKVKKNALWESSTHRGREGDDSQNKWNNYTVRYWIELNMHTYYYLLLLLLLYTLFFIYFEQRNLKNAPAKSTVLDGHPDRNIENIIKIQIQKKYYWRFVTICAPWCRSTMLESK